MSAEHVALLIIASLAMMTTVIIVGRRIYKRRQINQECVGNLRMTQGRHVRPSAAVTSSLPRRSNNNAVNTLITGPLAPSVSTSDTGSTPSD